MELILTEKPSVAMDIAKGLGDFKKHDGYMENDERIITWAIGHLVEIDDSIAPRRWELATLPIYPSRFTYKENERTKKQYKTIIKQLKRADKVVIATDPGREGELIARLILIKSGWKDFDKVYRFWTAEALSPEVVKKSFDKLIPSSEFVGLFYAAYARQHADWIAGINATRLVSVKAGGVWSVGRVQTPTLKIIHDRYQENINFKPVEYYNIKGFFQTQEEEEYEGQLQVGNKKLSKEQADEIVTTLENINSAEIESVKKEDKSRPAPLLHSLTTLQQEANDAYSYSAQETLDTAQNLYEKHKCISYPRTDSQHLPENNMDMVKQSLNKMAVLPEYSSFKEQWKNNIASVKKRVFNNKKLTDHHAVIPLTACPNFASEKEKNVYSLIARKFVGVFMDDYKYKSTVIITALEKHKFKTSGNVISALGWKALYTERDKSETLPDLKEGDAVKPVKYDKIQKFTEPPKLYTESSLLKLMEKLKLGTPATRASIIEKILKVNYIERKKKTLIPTEKGGMLVQHVGQNDISSPEMTGEWEEKLEKVENKSDYSQFMTDTKNFTTSFIEELKTAEIKYNPPPGEAKETFCLCNCGGNVEESVKAYNCTSCQSILWKTSFGKKMAQKDIKELFSGKEVELKGLKSKKGTTYDAKGVLKDQKLTLIFN